jgi:hypothetical protein
LGLSPLVCSATASSDRSVTDVMPVLHALELDGLDGAVGPLLGDLD